MVNYKDVNDAAVMAWSREDIPGLSRQLAVIGYLLIEIRDALQIAALPVPAPESADD